VISPLAETLRRRIETDGPLTVAQFMDAALGHPEHGYYRKQDPLGAEGDFTTAPEISQMFGEMIGLWLAVVWQSLGSPARVILAETGPGRGTLMADILRAAAMVPGFRQAAAVHLVETSLALRARQAAVLRDAAPVWHDDLSDLPADAPLLLVANEFLDALPIHQYVRGAGAWSERMVTVEGDAFVFAPGPAADIEAPPASDGDIFEIGRAARMVSAEIGGKLAAQGGAALLIDYGHDHTAVGDTLQAVRKHAYAPVLEAPGEADLTAHVDFQAVAEAAAPARAQPIVTQGRFLRCLGIELRAERLCRAQPDKAEDIVRACRRLIHASEMGTLFKVICLTHPDLPPPPGFSAHDS
jgi:NADH dehydrogenase [ubiquinone] 1 alpha subcomplex assembly factor 7